ncbi:MAG: ROK family protein [Patescibacteria group bacterium]|nr:ROK family protein [Patescibacteria group bacterium]
MIAKKYIVFDIGATKILKAVVKLRGRKFDFLEIEEEKNPRKEKRIKEIISLYCQKARKNYWTKKVAFSAAYIVNPEKKTVSGGKACYGTDNFNFKFLEEDGFLIRVENDGRCFALGEYYFGKGKGRKSILTLTLGTGIGGGYVNQGSVLRGDNFSALEVSHMKYPRDNRYQDWENLTVGRGIKKYYHGFSRKSASAKSIFDMANRGDADARKALRQAVFALGVGIANILNILDPEIVVFGGGISKRKDFVKKAVTISRKNVFNKKANCKFAISSLANMANLLGATISFGEK